MMVPPSLRNTNSATLWPSVGSVDGRYISIANTRGCDEFKGQDVLFVHKLMVAFRNSYGFRYIGRYIIVVGIGHSEDRRETHFLVSLLSNPTCSWEA